MARSPGFGAVPGSVGDQGIAPGAPVSVETMARDIRAIRERYVVPTLYNPISVNIAAANLTSYEDLSAAPFNAVLINVTTGVLDLFLGEFSGVTSSTQAPITVGTGIPVVVPVPYQGYKLVFRANGGAVAAVVTPMAL